MTTSDAYVLREATPADANALSALATRTFTSTFGHLFTDDDLLPFLQTAYDVDRVRAEIEDPQRLVLLAFPSNDLSAPCGYGMLHDGNRRPGDEDKDASQYMELKRLYVDDAHHGKGAARVLMDRMMTVIQRKNRPITWVGAWYKSLRAHSFYQEYGFVPTGERMFHVGKTQNPSIVFTLVEAKAPSGNAA